MSDGELQKYDPNEIQKYDPNEIQTTRSDMYDRWIRKQRKPKTIKTYMEAMTRFAQFLNLPMLQAAEELLRMNRANAYATVENFKVYLSEPHLVPKSSKPIICGPATINLSIAALRSFTREAGKRGVIDWRLDVGNLELPEPDRRGPGVEAITGILKLVDATAAEAPEYSARNAAMISLLFFMCMRTEEVRSLDVEHVLFDSNTIMIMRKRGVNRVPLTMSTEVSEALKIWIDLIGRKNGPLFPSFDPSRKGEIEKDGRITYGGMRSLVIDLAEKSGYEHHVRLHGFRHSGVTYALHVTNGDVRAVQRLTGHKDIKVLLKYDDERRDLGGEVAEKMSAAWRELNAKNRARTKKA